MYNETMYNEIHSYSDLKKYFPSMIAIEDHMNSTLEMIEFVDYLTSIMKNVFNIDECRAYPITFKIYNEDTDTYVLPLRQFIILMIIWVPLSKVWKHHLVDESFVETRTFSRKVRINLQNKIHQFLLFDCGITLRDTNALSHIAIWLLDRLATDFGLLVGTPMTLSSFILDAYDKDDRVKSIITHNFSDNLQTSELEKEIPKYYNKLVDILHEDHLKDTSVLTELIDAGSELKQKQVEEMVISYGRVANINGVVIQRNIQGNGVTSGYVKPSDFRIAATNAITSLILNYSLMGKAGYARRNEMILCLQKTMSRDVYDCGSKHPILVTIQSDLQLFQLNRRWYKHSDNDYYKQIDSNDKSLIGKTILIRSPITCALENEVCSVCYGGNSYLVSDIQNGACGYGAEEVFRPVEQAVLSNKHMRKTKASVILYSGHFDRYFIYKNGIIYIDTNLSRDILENTYISINHDDVDIQDFDDQSIRNPELYTSTFQLLDKDGEEIETISIENTMFTKITNRFYNTLNKKQWVVSLKDVSNYPLFILEVSNNDISVTLHQISKIIGTTEIMNYSASQALQKFISLGWKCGVTPSSLQFELILSAMISVPNHPDKRPNFKLPNVTYHFYSIKKKLNNHPSPLIQISFEGIKDKLKGNKLEQSISLSQFDLMFTDTISTDQLKEIRKNIKKSEKHERNDNQYTFGYIRDDV